MKEQEEVEKKEIVKSIENRQEEDVRNALADMHPADVAELLQEVDIDDAVFVFTLLDDETAAETITALSPTASLTGPRARASRLEIPNRRLIPFTMEENPSG